MSFDNIPPEITKRILGLIPNLRQRCRLERVSKTFQACLRDHAGAAWTTGETKLVLGRLLVHDPDFLASVGRVTSLYIRGGFSGLPGDIHRNYINALSALYRNVNVFRLTELCIDGDVVSTELWNWLLSSFHDSLIKLCIKARTPFLVGQDETVFNLLAGCENLKQLTIDHGVTIDADNLKVALKGKPMEKLSLTGCRQVSEVQLAQIINSFPEPRAFRELHIRRDGMDLNSFSLNDFCQGLDAAAGERISKICLIGVYGEFLLSLPTIPALFPALTHIEIKVHATELQATEVTQSLSEFLNAGHDREKPIHLNLLIFTQANEPLLTSIWPTLQLLAFNQSVCIKRMREDEEMRKVTYGQATLTLTLKPFAVEHEENGDAFAVQNVENGDGQEEDGQEHEEELEQLEDEEELVEGELEEQDDDEEEEEDSEDGEESEEDEMEQDDEEKAYSDNNEEEPDEEAEGNNFGDDGNYEEQEEADEVHEAGNNIPQHNDIFMPNLYFYPHGVVHDVDEEQE